MIFLITEASPELGIAKDQNHSERKRNLTSYTPKQRGVRCSPLREANRPENAILDTEPPRHPHPATAVCRLPDVTPQGQLGRHRDQVRRRERETAIAGCLVRWGGDCGKMWGHQGLYKEEGEHRPKGKM